MKVISRKLNWMLAAMLICFAICVVAIVFYRPSQSDDIPAINDALEEQRLATKEQIKARENMIEQAKEMVSYLRDRDSLLNNSINNNSDELKRIRNEKKTTDYTDYSSEQLQRAVADAARQYRAAGSRH